MYDTAQYDKYQLTPQFIYIQQLLRYISLKHGMKIVSLRNMVNFNHWKYRAIIIDFGLHITNSNT